jgi:hypothetical protein
MQEISNENLQTSCDEAVPYIEVLALLLVCLILVLTILIISRQILY